MTATFHWTLAAERLRSLLAEGPLAPGEKGHSWVRRAEDGSLAIEFRPPLVLPPVTADPEAWLESLPAKLGTEVVFLVQAGATAAGIWREDVLLRHKAEKKYVVRGKGRAQPTHLKTKGKSRYGSRLRLRNARTILEDLDLRLETWFREAGTVDRVYYSCPVRIWGDFFHTNPPPPFEKKDPRLVRIPLDVGVPTFEELQRVRGWLVHGRIG